MLPAGRSAARHARNPAQGSMATTAAPSRISPDKDPARAHCKWTAHPAADRSSGAGHLPPAQTPGTMTLPRKQHATWTLSRRRSVRPAAFNLDPQPCRCIIAETP
eukprot:3391855-Heterocapsa_arctica.AAC.1